MDHSTTGLHAIVFDLGNVLIDVDFMRCVRYWAEAASTTPATILQRFRIDRHYEAFEKGLLAAKDYFRILRRQLDLDLAEAAMTAGWNAILGDELPGIRGVVDALAERYTLFVLTNTNPIHEKVWATRHRSLLRRFAAVFVSSTIRLRKPEPAVYRYVAAHSGFSARHLLLLDDTAENVAGARACGWQALQVADPAAILTGLRPITAPI
jgi:HAD superfamily hydrolase (TIGR01509 family)